MRLGSGALSCFRPYSSFMMPFTDKLMSVISGFREDIFWVIMTRFLEALNFLLAELFKCKGGGGLEVNTVWNWQLRRFSFEHHRCISAHHIQQQKNKTRTYKQLEIESTNSEVYRNSFFPRTFKDWNILPQSAIDCETVVSFKQIISRD